MKIQDSMHGELRPLADKLAHRRVAMLTVEDSQQMLSSRPMTPLEMDADGALWMLTSRSTIPAASHSKPVNLAFVDEGDGDFVSVSGVASVVDDAGRKQSLWTAAARPWFSGPDDPDLVALKVALQRAEIWDGPDNAVSRTLSMVASVFAGREVGMGHKEVVEPGRPADRR